MKWLQVSLDYASTEYAPDGVVQTPQALPMRVLDADGSLIAEQVASTERPARFDLSALEGPAFVRLIWPSGRSLTRRVDLKEGEDTELSFTDTDISRNEWAAWAVPRLHERSHLAAATASQAQGSVVSVPALEIARFDRAWLRMWVRTQGEWTASRPTWRHALRSPFVRQLDFELDERCHLLQIGGGYVPWRFVALPGRGACRVLFTPNQSTDPRAEPLKIVVSSYRRDAENLLEFLSRDALRAAGALREFGPLATRMLRGKHEDPVSAAAAAYFLLRSDGWREIPMDWFANLSDQFDWLADASLVHCVAKLRSGLASPTATDLAIDLLRKTMARGVPLFSEGMALLREAAASLGPPTGTPTDSLFEHIDRLTTSETWSGAAFSFSGTHPDQPTPERVLGMPGRPRLARRDGPRKGEHGDASSGSIRGLQDAVGGTASENAYVLLRDLS